MNIPSRKRVNRLFHMQPPISVILKKLVKARMESVKSHLINLQKDTKSFGSQGWSGCQVHLLSALILSQPAVTFGRHSTLRFIPEMKRPGLQGELPPERGRSSCFVQESQ